MRWSEIRPRLKVGMRVYSRGQWGTFEGDIGKRFKSLYVFWDNGRKTYRTTNDAWVFGDPVGDQPPLEVVLPLDANVEPQLR